MAAMTLRDVRMRIQTEDPLYYGQKKLKMQGRDLMNLPKVLFKLMDLEVLDLSPEREPGLNFRLTSIPPSIGKLINLSTLIIDTNELEEVPAEITLLTNLERLALSNNQLSALPSGFNRLKKLTSLHVANNEFEKFPAEICDLSQLTFLDLSDNKIRVLPKSIDKLTKLETLLLFYNELTKLPATIKKMTELRCLWLGNNKITYLPQGFGYLTKLDWKERYTSSTLDGNPILSPPIEICRMGPEAIEQFQGIGPNIDKANEEPKKPKSNGYGVRTSPDGNKTTPTKSPSDSSLNASINTQDGENTPRQKRSPKRTSPNKAN